MKFMYKAPSKKREIIRRTIIYTVMSTSVILVVTLLVFIMLGFRFNRDTNTVQQGGLVQFASQPVDANIKIGSASLVNPTPSKITVNPGRYTVTMNRADYKQWQKTVDVRAAEVLWLNYTRLLPNTIETTDQGSFANISSVKSSPDGKKFAVLENATTPSVTLVDVGGATPTRESVSLPQELVPAGATEFAIDRWNPASDRLLMTAKTPTETVWLMINLERPDRSFNVSRSLGNPLAAVRFDPRGGDRVFTISNARELKLVDLNSTQTVGVAASGVDDITTYNNEAIVIVDNPEAGTKRVSYRSLGADSSKELKRIKTTERVTADLSAYFSERYLAYSVGAKVDLVRLETLPSSESDVTIKQTTITSTSLPSAVTYLSIRSGGRFMVSQYAGGIDTYDLELEKHTPTTIQTLQGEELRWIDRYHYYVQDGQTLSIAEFDGGNPGTITASNTSLDVVSSSDAKYVWSFQRLEPGGYVLKRSQTILD